MSQVLAVAQVPAFTPEELKLITEVVAPGATAKELQLFLHRCQLMGLNPLKPGQIHFVKYGNSPGTIVIGIEGFRAIAGRTGKLSGVKRGVIKDDKGKLTGAWAEVYRSDWREPAREEVPISEYNTGKGPWSKMPETMIKKVAEAAALRMAFPDNLGGIYESAEMDQATNSPPKFIVDQPGPNDAIRTPIAPSKITKGMYSGYDVKELSEPDLNHKIELLQEKESEEGLSADEKRLLDEALHYRETLKNMEPEVAEEPKAKTHCKCGLELKLSKSGKFYFCPDFKNGAAHINPVKTVQA